PVAGDPRFGADQSAEFDLGPKELMARVAQVLAGTGPKVVQQTKDTLLTDWESHVGDWHIMRHWQERTRDRVTGIPDSDRPAGRGGAGCRWTRRRSSGRRACRSSRTRATCTARSGRWSC